MAKSRFIYWVSLVDRYNRKNVTKKNIGGQKAKDATNKKVLLVEKKEKLG